MLTAYVFSLVLGGGFLLLSVFGDLLGGDADVDMDGHLDFDHHLELNAGADVDVDADSHVGAASKIFSLRTLVYSLAGFGAMGSVMTWVGIGGPVSTPLSALGVGAVSGAMVSLVFGYIRATESGAALGDSSYIGLSATVTLPLSSTAPGAIAVKRGNRRMSLRALPHETSGGSDMSTWKTVVVVEMEKGVAKVAPVTEELSS